MHEVPLAIFSKYLAHKIHMMSSIFFFNFKTLFIYVKYSTYLLVTLYKDFYIQCYLPPVFVFLNHFVAPQHKPEKDKHFNLANQ